MLKPMFSFIAMGLTVIGFYPYIRSIVRHETNPHVISWLIWGITTLIVFVAQLHAKGGVGAWPIGLSACITIGIAVYALMRHADSRIYTIDWCFLISAVLAIPVWVITANPLGAVVVLTIVDLLGFGPTIKKVYHQPYSESVSFYVLFMGRNLMVIAALEQYSLTTVLFPLCIAVACALLVVLMQVRRK